MADLILPFRRLMKHVINVSLGSSKRDKQVTIKFKDEEILVERFGADGDVVKARDLNVGSSPQERDIENIGGNW